MRIVESILKCNECRKTSNVEELETMTRDGKEYWVCPHCDFETPMEARAFNPRTRTLDSG